MSESDSSVEPRPIGDSFARSSHAGLPAGSQIWLDGDVLSCACPDCGAPMTIRVWLSLAECRMCGALVELTEEQERFARQLLEARETPQAAKPAAPPIKRSSPPTWSQPVPPIPPAPATAPSPPPIAKAPPPRPPRRLPAKPLIAEVVGPKPLIARPADALPQPAAGDERLPKTYGRSWLQQLISVLLSVLINMLLIILLGLFYFEMPAKPKVLMFEAELLPPPSGQVGSQVIAKPKPKPEPAVQKPVPKETPQPQKSEQPKMLASIPPIDTKALTAKIVPAPIDIAPPPASSSASGSGSPARGTLLAGRDRSLRAQVLNIEGGDERTEMAVALGLKWLASHQHDDGHWGLETFEQAGECRGRCDDRGHAHSDTAATAMALLPFLGAGFTHRGDHEYRDLVEKGLQWLIAAQLPTGDLRGQGAGNMYAHGQASIVLCEAYALTEDTKLRGPAQKAIDFIVAAQDPRGGGWRYNPGERGDTSVVGWQLMALRSAQMAHLRVPVQIFSKSEHFLTTVQTDSSQGTFAYMPGMHRTKVMTAEGLLCRLYSGWRTDYPPLNHGVDWLLKSNLPAADDINMYYLYYATQVMHHVGGDRWKKWNDRTKTILVESQVTRGHMAGSWTPTEMHDRIGGRLYMTALAVCTLEVYYRHMPLYKNSVVSGER